MTTHVLRSSDPTRARLWRSRWAAIGAAVAVSLGAGGLFVAQAAPGPAESTIVSVTPERILDTRDPNNLGLAGPFVSPVSQKLKVTGSIPTATGTKTVVPAGATGVLLNVTAVGATANGFISVRPGDATGTPSTSSLNFDAGSVVPNSVQVSMPTAGANAGQIDITFDAYGQAGRTTDILIDVVGYTTNTGLQQLVADVAAKANTSDVNAALATKANTSAVAALPGSNIFAAGSVTAAGAKSSDTPQIGSYTVSRSSTGVYSLVLTTPCLGADRFPLVMLTLGYNTTNGQIALGNGSCNTPTAGQVTYTVNTRDASGVAANHIWQFMAIGGNSQLAGAAPLESGELTECEMSAGASCD